MSTITRFRLIFFIANEIVEVLLGHLEYFLGIITSNYNNKIVIVYELFVKDRRTI